jgi:hypothetical protein
MKVDSGIRGYLQWLQRAQPRLYREVRAKLPKMHLAGLAGNTANLGMGDVTFSPVKIPDLATTLQMPNIGMTPANTSAGTLETIKNIVTTAAGAYLTAQQLKAQNEITRIQLDRARQGLPPLDIDPARYGLQPTVGIGIEGDTMKKIGIGFAALLGVMALSGRRRGA